MLHAPLLISVVLLQAAAAPQAPAPAAPPRDWVVIVAAPVYLPDGSVRSETTALPTTGAGLVHLFSRKTMCAPAASAAAEPGDAAFGWRVASQIVTRSDTDVVISLDWRRLWDAGKRVSNGPGGTVQLTLHPGDRIPLDHIANFSPSADCRAVGLGIEVKLARAAPVAPPPSASAVPIGATAGGAKPVNTELWLTHTSPSGSEQVSHQVVRLPEAGGRFTFTNKLSTTRGELNIELAGTIDRFRSPTGGEFFVLSMTRHVTGDSLPPAGISATTGTTIPMPGVDEVPSFELTGVRRAIAGGGGRGGALRGGSGSGAPGGMAGARSSGGGGTTGTEVRASPRSGGGGGGAVVARATSGQAATAGANLAQVAVLLEGHQFSLRLRVTAVN